MASKNASKSSSPNPEPLDLESSLPTTPADSAALSALRNRPVPGLLERINELSATRLFPNLRQRSDTSDGFDPFTL